MDRFDKFDKYALEIDEWRRRARRSGRSIGPICGWECPILPPNDGQ